MIKLELDWRETLWWMQGGMCGSHLRWNVYDDMVNKVWPQCSEQERRNIWLIMRRDLGSYWRPDGWNSYDPNPHGEGPWKADYNGYAIDRSKPDAMPQQVIHDVTPWTYFRQVLARFDPENQYAVTLRVEDEAMYLALKRTTNPSTIISLPKPPLTRNGETWQSETATFVCRAYKWNEHFMVDWNRRCDPERIVKVERLEIPDTGEM